MSGVDFAIAVVCGYLLGSIPFGLIVSRFSGVDLREHGSGRTGFTNSLRLFGMQRSVPVFAGDFAKGIAATLLPLLYSDDPWVRAAGGLAAVAGHVWPLFAGFRGGRGVLTGAAVLVALDPLVVVVVAPFALVLYTTRYMSLASITGVACAVLLFVALAATGVHSWAYAFAALIGGPLIIALHHDNIGRLRAGTERKIGRREALPQGNQT